ncbi:MAG TPA: hypothetical protein VK675_02830 [Candidatus Paceibacterota bacterium]|nr:hypothetical protein [Candidatus Paceibacterota bacterium]
MQLRKQRQRIFQSRIFLRLGMFLVIFFGLAFLARLPGLNIADVEIVGNKVVDSETIKTTVKNEIYGNYLWFFPKTDIFFFPKNSIIEALNNRIPRLDGINLTVKDNKILEISVSEREAKYLWCGATPVELKSDSKPKCYFLDKNGYIFDEAPYFSGDVYFTFYGAIDFKEDVPLGLNFLPANFGKLVTLIEMLQSMKLVPVALYLQENGDIKIFLSGKSTLSGPDLIFRLDSDLSAIVENLETALTTEPLQSNFKKKYSSLEYIDLRYGNKVYYRFR